MSAQWRDAGDQGFRCVPMTVADLGAVMAIERVAYEFPWTHGNFVDSLAAGYSAQLLRSDVGTIGAYYVAMSGVDETHLLNLTVAPAYQGRGLALRLLDTLVAASVAAAAHGVMLEVRPSNARARAIYRRYGFDEVGLRPGYYPAAQGQREAACVMRLALGAGPSNTARGDALE